MINFQDATIDKDITLEEGGASYLFFDGVEHKGYSLFIYVDKNVSTEIVLTEKELKGMLKEIKQELI